MSNKEKKKHRQEKILFSLAKLGFLTRTHLRYLHDLKSNRNTSRIMKELEEYVHMKRHYERNGEAVYYLNKKGLEFTGCEKEFKWTDHVEHYLMRNDLYLYFGQPSDWRTEERLTFKMPVKNGARVSLKEYSLVPDAIFTRNNRYHFIEVDRKQTMKENKRKIAIYKELKEGMKKHYGYSPSLIFYTVTGARQKQLEAWCQEAGIPCKVFRKEDLL